ncbi:MAG: hypothetical protein MRY76_03000 [Pseudomonadales bacterium]|nr:hypothetical protein [Pseudomonadales bacterium]
MLRITQQSLALALIFLLLASSSMALESAVHDAHGHDKSMAAHAMSADGQHGELSGMDHSMHGALSAEQSEDCFCDELCCLSSFDLGSFSLPSPAPQHDGSAVPFADLYQSIALDLVLPPPNA